jgi:hypothetical protein
MSAFQAERQEFESPMSLQIKVTVPNFMWYSEYHDNRFYSLKSYRNIISSVITVYGEQSQLF